MSANALIAALTLSALGIFLGIMKLRRKLTAHKFAISLSAYWSLFFLSMVHAEGGAWTTRQLLVDAGILVVCWSLLYVTAFWIYRAVNS